MTYILGIDTGGTYTDGVIIDSHSKRIVCKAKALTTKEDLRIGIRNCIEGLNFNEFDKIILVSLSTTLATNAIVEGKGCSTGLILIGSVPTGDLPVEHYEFLDGLIDIKGHVKIALSEEKVFAAANNLKGTVDSVAISGYASVRNPQHELTVKKVVREVTGLPVFCAHELTGALGHLQRTVTTVLNASLIKIINEFLTAVRKVLSDKNISAPVMVVKGDGSLMQESMALEKPIETILSGPAASIIGARHLSGIKDAFILDMGGTTTDIANIVNGHAKIGVEGAKVGGWFTRVQAAEISTYGLGGDSLIHLNSESRLEIGPEKVEPLCVIGFHNPNLEHELKHYRTIDIHDSKLWQKTDCFVLKKNSNNISLSAKENQIINILKESAHNIHFIKKKLNLDLDALPLENLLYHGIIARVSFTPTDVLHALNRYTQWNRTTPLAGAELLASVMDLDPEQFLALAKNTIYQYLGFYCIQSAADFENEEFDFRSDDAALYLIEKAFHKENEKLMNAHFKILQPIIAVGAPVREWMPPVAELLHTNLIIPEHAEVANAVGAGLGTIMETCDALIRPEKKKGSYVLFMPDIRKVFNSRISALKYAEEALGELAKEKAVLAGSKHVEIELTHEHIYSEIFSTNKKMYVETRIKAIANGTPVIKEF